MVRRQYLLGFGAFVALLCLMAILYSLSTQSGGIPMPTPSGNYTQQPGQVGTLTVQIIDPSFLPKGTTALLVTFSNASVFSQGKWLTGGGFGPVNIMTQGNQSITISSIGVPQGSVISAARLGIKSAAIIINGVRYNASFSGGYILTNISAVRVLGVKTLVLQLSPFALTATGSSGSNVRLGYSSRGYLLNNSGGYVGQTNRVSLESSSAVTPYANVTVQNAAISTSGGVTTMKVTVINHSNRTAHIKDVAIVGNENFTHNSAAITQLANSYADEIMQKYQTATQSGSSGGSGSSSLLNSLFNTTAIKGSGQINQQVYSQILGAGSNITNIVYSNVSALAAIAGPIPKALFGNGNASGTNVTALRAALYQNIYNGFYNASVSQSDFQSNVGSVDFTPSQDGTLQQSYNSSGGYSIPPDSTATFNYTGQMALDNSTSMALVPQSSYDVVVAGSDGTSTNDTVNST